MKNVLIFFSVMKKPIVSESVANVLKYALGGEGGSGTGNKAIPYKHITGIPC